MAIGLNTITSLLSQQTAQAISAGLLFGAIGGTVLMVTGVIPLGGTAGGVPTVELLACPGDGPVLAEVTDGQSLLVTARSADGEWYEVYVGQPEIDRAWVPATTLEVEAAADSLPVADCLGPTPGPLPSPVPSTAESPTPSAPAVASPTASAGPGTPGVSTRPTTRPTPTPRVTPSRKPSQAPTKPPSAPPSKPPTAPPPTTPPDTEDPSLSNMTANPTCIDPAAPSSTIRVTATDDRELASVTLNYQQPGMLDVFSVAMSNTAGNQWEATITRNLLWQSEGYVQYWVVAVDASGNQAQLEDDPTFATNNWLYHSLTSCGTIF